MCDMAETYGIYSEEQVPLKIYAALAAGLRPPSRIMTKMAGLEQPLETVLLASILDHVKLLWWSRTVDGQEGQNRPKSILRALLGDPDGQAIMSFESGEEFIRQWEAAVNGK